jgi:predicted nucleic acid-binding protein
MSRRRARRRLGRRCARSEVLSRAEALVSGSSLRTLDAIHVASALLYQRGSRRPFLLVTADARQRDAARQLVLTVTWVG